MSKLIRQHKMRLGVTYLLFSLEMTGALLRPFFLGMAINDLMQGSYRGLIILSAVHFAWLVIGTIRHRYDTRTYSTIYTSLVTKFLSKRIKSAEVSKLSAHSTLAREFVDFLEFDLVYIIEAFYNIVGSMILLFFYQSSVVFLCLAILLPVMAISYIYGKKMKRLTRLKNDELEKQVNIISSGDNKAIHRHFNNLRKWQIRISDQEAWNFGIMEMMVMVVIAVSLLITNQVTGTTVLAGHIIGIYNYILKFVSGLDTIPYTVQRITALNDITQRIQLQMNEQEEEISPSSVPSIKPRESAA
ncbi:ABC transporter six-transmembrane domain-containing protein [Sediminibacterium sp.]|uniref:ABC transporter six-transmembrane domain-containing protein n=1 Tax=Sediminibacterium sp. TaxID=1917865 RepID=UPI0025E784E7|nr:ABC transporter six-transmembrane domain-containing protein [Sediminibacterium sp.]MBW0176975.1 ABC transporter six-transmembrane domain-containing protein [Sediminibacterium sp.]